MSREFEIENIACVLCQDIHITPNLASILATALVDKIKVGTKDRFMIEKLSLPNWENYKANIKPIEYKTKKEQK